MNLCRRIVWIQIICIQINVGEVSGSWISCVRLVHPSGISKMSESLSGFYCFFSFGCVFFLVLIFGCAVDKFLCDGGLSIMFIEFSMGIMDLNVCFCHISIMCTLFF